MCITHKHSHETELSYKWVLILFLKAVACTTCLHNRVIFTFSTKPDEICLICRLREGAFLGKNMFPLSTQQKTLCGISSLVCAASLFHYGRLRREETVIWWGKKKGRLYNGGINIPENSESPPGEGDQRDHKRDLFHPRIKTLLPLNFLCTPRRKFNWQQRDRELHIWILQTSAFYTSQCEDKPPTQMAHSFDAFYLHYPGSNNGVTRAWQRLVCSNFWHWSWVNLVDARMIYGLFSSRDN